MVVISSYLINNPYKQQVSVPLRKNYESAKSSISSGHPWLSSDNALKSKSVIFRLWLEQVVALFYAISSHEAKKWSQTCVTNFQKATVSCQVVYIYLSDLLQYTCHFENIGRMCRKLLWTKIDAVMTVATKVCRSQMQLPMSSMFHLSCAPWFEKYRRFNGPSVNYVSGFSGDCIEKNVHFKARSLKASSRVLIVDDFWKAAETVNGMISLLREFDSELAGVAVFTRQCPKEEREKQFDYKSLLKVTNIDVRSNPSMLRLNIFDEDK